MFLNLNSSTVYYAIYYPLRPGANLDSINRQIFTSVSTICGSSFA